MVDAMNLKKIFDGYSNNPDYFWDWFGKGQIDFSKVLNADGEGDKYFLVKLWCGRGYVLDTYVVKADNVYDAIDYVFEWSYNNEGANEIVFDYDYLSEACEKDFKDYPDLFGTDLSDNFDEFEMRWFDDYVSSDSEYYARSENFYVDEIPAEVIEEYKK